MVWWKLPQLWGQPTWPLQEHLGPRDGVEEKERREIDRHQLLDADSPAATTISEDTDRVAGTTVLVNSFRSQMDGEVSDFFVA